MHRIFISSAQQPLTGALVCDKDFHWPFIISHNFRCENERNESNFCWEYCPDRLKCAEYISKCIYRNNLVSSHAHRAFVLQTNREQAKIVFLSNGSVWNIKGRQQFTIISLAFTQVRRTIFFRYINVCLPIYIWIWNLMMETVGMLPSFGFKINAKHVTCPNRVSLDVHIAMAFQVGRKAKW